MPNVGLRLNDLTATSADHLIWVTYLLDDTTCKEVPFTVDDLTNTFAITDGVGLIKAIVGLLDWVQTVNVQTGRAQYVRDTHLPTFHWEGDDLIVECEDLVVAKQISVKIQTTFAHQMGWSVKKKDGMRHLGQNYVLRDEWDFKLRDSSTKKVKGFHQVTTSLSRLGDKLMIATTND